MQSTELWDATELGAPSFTVAEVDGSKHIVICSSFYILSHWKFILRTYAPFLPKVQRELGDTHTLWFAGLLMMLSQSAWCLGEDFSPLQIPGCLAVCHRFWHSKEDLQICVFLCLFDDCLHKGVQLSSELQFI